MFDGTKELEYAGLIVDVLYFIFSILLVIGLIRGIKKAKRQAEEQYFYQQKLSHQSKDKATTGQEKYGVNSLINHIDKL